MDYILNRINSDINILDEESYEYVVSLRKRIEYSLYFLLGYLWNQNSESLPIEKQLNLATTFDRMSIGEVATAITSLTKGKDVLRGKNARKVIDKYPVIRNTKIGHGYALSSELVGELINLYEDMKTEIPMLQNDYSLILVERKKQGTYHGIRIDRNGQRHKWVCPEESFCEENNFPRTYLMEQQGATCVYYKLSPFVMLKRDGLEIKEYVFSSLNDSYTGAIKLCPLTGNAHTGSDDKSKNPDLLEIYSEFAKFSRYDDDMRDIGMNGTVMNRFECNFQSGYQEVGFSKIVLNFLKNDRSAVSATLWGHGGVGKTACIQYVCQQLFHAKEQHFSYIVFVTAKDRIYNSQLGKIIPNRAKYVRRYREVIETIIQTIAPDYEINDSDQFLAAAEQKIKNHSGRLLIVIDDYETFLDEEKQKISFFIQGLDINHHKVVITTRNLRLAIGTAIKTDSLDATTTCNFLQAIIDSKSPELSNTLKKELTRKGISEKILAATNGRPIFIYQFAYLYMQTGMQSNIFSELHNGSEARNFLYGRVYDYLTETGKIVFSAIQTIVNDDLLFRFDILRYILENEVPDNDKFDAAIEEIREQLVIEQYSDIQGRVYAQELLPIMQERYMELIPSRRNAIHNRIKNLGGKEISGTIEEAMLQEADKSRLSGNVEEIIEKYKRVLKLKDCPTKLSRQALLNATSYLSSLALSANAAELFAEYIPLFKDDAQIALQYLECLWQQEDRKADAVTFVRQFFSKASGHKRTSERYLQLFAIGTSYCTDYDLNLRRYGTIANRRAQLSQTIGEYGKELFKAVQDNFLSLKPAVKHAVQMGLIQTAKACADFDAEGITKIDFGIEICRFAEGRFVDPFAMQANKLYTLLLKKAKLIAAQRKGIDPADATTPSWWDKFISQDYHIGDVIDGVVSGIVAYGLFVRFGKNYEFKGLLHISKISQDFLPSDYLPNLFQINQVLTVRIIRIDENKKHVDFSLIELI